MKLYRVMLCLCMSIVALLMPETTVSAQQLWKTCWSPDGEKIAFGDVADIWIINADGGDPVNLTGELDYQCSCPVFSPDGMELYFSAIRESEDSHVCGWKSDICAINPETESIRTIRENAYAPSFSPDGRIMAYIKDWDRYAVYDMESGFETVYDYSGDLPPFFCGGHITVSPDNRYFIARFEYGNNVPFWNKYKLYRVAVETGELEMIEIDNKNYIYPQYSPDGHFLLFSQAGMNEKYKLAIYDIDCGSMTVVNDCGAEMKCGSWSPDGSKICYICNDDDASSLNVYDIATGGNTILYTKSAHGVTIAESVRPISFKLYDNYPNPFNPVTIITFQLHCAGYVRMDVYNIQGQNVRTLVSEYRNEGTHDIIWNGRDRRGVAVSSGVYVCRLVMGEQVTAIRMSLVR